MDQIKRNIYRCRAGVSLLISLILVSILVLFSLGVSNLVVTSIRESANMYQGNQAYYAAEGGLEKGLLVNANQGTAGYSKDLDLEILSSTSTTKKSYTPGDPGVIAATVKIQGKSPASSKIDGEYVIPTPGTGTAGKDCDPLNPNVTATVSSTPPTSGLDDACNWNKIKVGETVGVPLYATAGDGSILNPVDLKLKSLKVKVRTPCKDGGDVHGNCAYLDRYSLNITDGDPTLKCNPPTKSEYCGDTIVSWQIVGTNVGGDKTYTMGAYDVLSKSGDKRTKLNSEIYEWLINSVRATGTPFTGFTCGAPFCVLYATDSGSRSGTEIQTILTGSIYEFLMNTVYFSRFGDNRINKPLLKLTVVNSLKNESNITIPYLEYQITSNVGVGDKPPADSAQTITAEGFSGPFKQVLEVRQPQETGLLEYVIQQ